MKEKKGITKWALRMYLSTAMLAAAGLLIGLAALLSALQAFLYGLGIIESLDGSRVAALFAGGILPGITLLALAVALYPGLEDAP